MKSVALVLNTTHPSAAEVGRKLLSYLNEIGVCGILEEASASLLGETGLPLAKALADAEGLIVAGGDGTLLTTVPAAADVGLPVLGLNMGSLGFLTPVPVTRYKQAIRGLVQRQWKPLHRSLLDVSLYRRSSVRPLGVALNDAVVSRSAQAVLIRFEVQIDDKLMTTYAADGLVVATPTGSTAYSLSANGAIIAPEAPVLALTPICPHTLSNRPIIISDQSAIRIRPDRHDRLMVTLDGHRAFRIPADGSIQVGKSTKTLALLQPPSQSHFDVLRTKLHWRGSLL